ncbi:phosphotransferase-like protein [Aureococcus anophagefferens]|nr:phosphotransferase-like protein [Aureococcus anophagefferens]
MAAVQEEDAHALRFDGIDLRERIGAALCDDVADVRVVPGTVLAWPQSTSAALVATTRAGAEHALYLKKVASADATDRRSNEVEATFYAEFAAELRRGAPVCEALVVEDRVAAAGGALFVLRRCPGAQRSPHDEARAAAGLRLLAAFHRAGADRRVVARARARLHASAGTWSWRLRGGPAALAAAVERWPAYLAAFRPVAPALRPARFDGLAARLARAAPAVAAALERAAAGDRATLVHGDAKAMNIVDPAALDGGGEARLVASYVAARYGGAERGAAAEAADHYELSVLDYARHLFSGLPTDAGDAAFAARRDRANAGLVSRYPAASIRLAVRVDEILRARFPEYG